MTAALARLRRDLGTAGLAAIAILAIALAAHLQGVRPLEARIVALKAELDARALLPRGDTVRPAAPAARLAAFHEFFRRDETTVEWLAKLHATAAAHGIELRQAEYRDLGRQGRLERYQVTFPVAGSYPRIRRFVEEALVDLPIMSLDQASFRRKRAADAVVEAELVVTLHLARP